jgi:two-component system, OmpR family, response regulator MprA
VSTRILVVDDDRAVRDALQRALRLHDYEVLVAADGMEALRLVHGQHPAVIVLDVMMPGVDGFGVVRRLRADGDQTPVLLLTARDAVGDRVTGLDVGADDYLVKPFALEELLARLRALIRRTADPAPDDARPLRFGDITLDPASLEVRRGDRVLDLTRTEFDLLTVFLENPNRVLTRDVLHERVWGYDAATASNTLEVYVGYLRRKLEAGGEPRVLQTLRGFGYVLRAP